MTRLSLTKHHGLGNDFLVVFDPQVPDLVSFAHAVCDRRVGIGADGLLVGEPADGYAARMVLYNADGSRAEISGNGLRCFAHALARRAGTLDELRIITDAGERTVAFLATADPHVVEAAVDMGEISELPEPPDWALLACDAQRPVAHLGVGNPHSVVAVDDVAAVDLLALGRLVPYVNLEIVEAGPEANAITMRVHERGAGLTQACGTGACAAAWAAVQWGLVSSGQREIVVHMPGGSAKVLLHEPSPGRVTLVGPSVFVATITYEIENR